MYVTLNEPERHRSSIVRFRRGICGHLGITPGPATVDPLPYAFYLFGFRKDLCEPVGMVKFFFYDQAFADYRSAPDNHACDLSRIGAIHEVAHVRSVIVDEPHRHARMFLNLCSGMTLAAHLLGARYLSAGTDPLNAATTGLHREAGMTKLGTYPQAGAFVQLSLVALELVERRVKALRH